METEDWFKLKKYPHIGTPLSIVDYGWVSEYVKDEQSVSRHSFLPFIHKCIVTRKYRANKELNKKNKSGKRRRVIGKPKVRHIYYSSHFDSLIFSYYNQLLYKKYEEKLADQKFNESVVAYRKIPIHEGSEKNKCNIDFAKSAFEFISDRPNEKLSIIVADVTSFFDNLNHKHLKKQWSHILGRNNLCKDHYNIFKAITRFRYVESDQLAKSYHDSMIVEKGVPNSSRKKMLERTQIKSPKFYREKNAVAFCSKEDFLKKNLNLVISVKETFGIPQGSPISATLANIYMWDFDKTIYSELDKINGFYQRYSDDIIIVCDQQYEDQILRKIRTRIDEHEKLEIHESKTKVYRFQKIDQRLKCFLIDEKSKIPDYNYCLEYLGFSFDGERVLIKSAGMSKFYRSMKRSFRKSTSLAIHSKNPDKSIFKSRLFKRFTHRGAKRKLIFRPSKDDPKKYERTKQYYWGNYLSYINKANNRMKSINKSDAIRRQSRKFWKQFNKLMEFHSSRLPKEGIRTTIDKK